MTTYSDLNTSYSPDNIRTSPTSNNMEAIKRSLLRLFSTPIGSVPFNRGYGSHLYEMLFENDLDLHDVRMFLYMDIQTWEPRVSLSPLDITLTRKDEHTYEVNCIFTVPSLNNQTSAISTSVSE